MSKNRYRNPLRTPWLARIVFGCLTAAAIAASYAVLQNRKVKQGDRIIAAEQECARLDKEIEMWELRIAGQLDRGELSRRLKWVESDLEDISAARILVLAPQEEVAALPRVAQR